MAAKCCYTTDLGQPLNSDVSKSGLRNELKVDSLLRYFTGSSFSEYAMAAGGTRLLSVRDLSYLSSPLLQNS